MNEEIYSRIKHKWDLIAKPIDGLGAFEDIICRIGAITEDESLECINRSALVIMCADNGVVAEGVTQTTQDVTAAVAAKMGRGESSVCRMAAYAGTDVYVYDVGMSDERKYEGVDRRYRMGPGTHNMAKEPAMSMEDMERCIDAGISIVGELKEKGYGIIATGEMGIGNTTTSACVSAALLRADAAEVTGRGAGLSDEGLEKKIKTVREAIEKYELMNADVKKILSCVGGYDIAALTGVILGGLKYDMPVILDGFITETAALAACAIDPDAKKVLIASHSGNESGAHCIEESLGLKPVIHAGMRLGEGTGAVMLINLIKQAMTVYREVYSFEAINMDTYRRF